ncbi:MAG: RNA pseudouridine synthase, partial [Muribaculaceae bacterium]|nr:RNA pseudouridine synthase [Muribaculaceae bacterium]
MKQPQKHNSQQRQSKEFTYHVDSDCQLLDFLIATLKDKSRTTVKSYLSHRQVAVNDMPTTQFNTPLHRGDRITINFSKGYKIFRHRRLRIIFE